MRVNVYISSTWSRGVGESGTGCDKWGGSVGVGKLFAYQSVKRSSVCSVKTGRLNTESCFRHGSEMFHINRNNCGHPLYHFGL